MNVATFYIHWPKHRWYQMYVCNHRIIIGLVSLGIFLSPLAAPLDAQFIVPAKKEVPPPETTVTPPPPPPPQVQDVPPPEEPKEYLSPLKGNLSGEYLKNLTGHHQTKKGATRKYKPLVCR